MGMGSLVRDTLRVARERAGAFQGVEGVSAARVIQPGEGVPGQRGPQP